MTDPFTVNDRRGRFVVGQSVDDAKKMTRDANDLMRKNFGDTNPYTQAFSRNQTPDAVLQEMRLNRRVSAMKKRATPGGYGMGGIDGGNFGGGSNVSFATGRPRDPLFYWRENNLPYDITKDSELKKIRAFCSLLYLTHPIIASCIDIFTKFPLQGMEIRCNKDEQIEEFYNNLFFDELDYRNYIVDISHQRWLCVVPGSRVDIGAKGSIPIEEIRVGDAVLTHRSRMRPVVRTMERTYRGAVFTIKPHYGLPITVTDEHPILVSRDGDSRWVVAKDVVETDEVFVPVEDKIEKKEWISVWESLDRHGWEVFDSEALPDPTWTPRYAKYQRERTRRMQREGIADGTILRPIDGNKGRYSLLRPNHVVDDALLRLFGLYLAEGFASKDGPQWAFNAQTEQHYMDEVQEIVHASWGIAATRNDQKGVVFVNHANYGRWMASMFGNGEKHKHMPPWMTQLSPEKAAIVLRGLFDGDGHARAGNGNPTYELTTASPVLRDQVANLIRRAGFIVTMREHHSVRNGTPCTWWTVGATSAEAIPFAEYLGWTPAEVDETFGLRKKSESRYPFYARQAVGGYWVKIHRIEQKEYEGLVYNLTVEEDNSFVCSVATHNCGEAWPLGSFNETLGVWEDDELLNPDDVEVERSALVKDPRFLIRLPETLRKVLQERSPRWEYNSLIKNYPELQSYAAEDSLMPVSNMLLKQVKFQADTFHKRGIPILMRAFRSVVQEEMLNAALDAIADRLYTPLILVKLGASASDLGTEVPWIPTQDDLETFEESMDAALAGDFRVLVNHFATDITSVFGRENMPDLTGDFERITDKILQVFGISQTMLNGGQAGETYAADALNRDMMATLLTDHQLHLKDFFHDRARIVAEAQEHYDFEVRGGIRYVKMEEVLKIDEESGEETIVEQPKLLVPTLEFETLTLTDKNTERQFREMLVQAGVPIPMKSRILGMGLDFDDMLSEKEDEQVLLAVAEQQTRRETYKALRDQRLPIPEDLASDFRPVAKQPGTPLNPAQDAALPLLGALPQDLPALAPTMEDQQGQDEQDDPGPQDQDGPSNVIMMPVQTPQEGDQRPPESDEQRANMPKPANRTYPSQKVSKTAQVAYDRRVRGQIKTATANHYEAPDNSIEDPDKPEHWQPTGKFAAPKVVGMRQHVAIPESMKWREELDNDEGTA